MNESQVERIWRREGRKVPARQTRGRLWLNDGSCVRLRAERANHVMSYDVMEDRTYDGRTYRMLNVVDEFTRACLAICVERRLRRTDVIDVLSDLFILRGVPGLIRSDNGPAFVAKAVQKWIHGVGASTAYIAPESPWENGNIERFNARMRDELFDGEIFYTLREARTVIDSWHRHFNGVRPHSALGHQASAPQTTVLPPPAWPAPLGGAAPPAYRWCEDQPFTNIDTEPSPGRRSSADCLLVLLPLPLAAKHVVVMTEELIKSAESGPPADAKTWKTSANTSVAPQLERRL